MSSEMKNPVPAFSSVSMSTVACVTLSRMSPRLGGGVAVAVAVGVGNGVAVGGRRTRPGDHLRRGRRLQCGRRLRRGCWLGCRRRQRRRRGRDDDRRRGGKRRREDDDGTVASDHGDRLGRWRRLGRRRRLRRGCGLWRRCRLGRDRRLGWRYRLRRRPSACDASAVATRASTVDSSPSTSPPEAHALSTRLSTPAAAVTTNARRCLRRTTPLVTRGAEGQNRTDDTSIFSAVLYQLSYLGGGDAAAPEGAEPNQCIHARFEASRKTDVSRPPSWACRRPAAATCPAGLPPPS